MIERGEHALITAPTGSGKTLTAFLWSINRCLVGDLEPGSTRVLYISPLKALNNDIQRNLVGPLGALRQRASDAGSPFPDIRVQTRSGDTDAGDHHRMLRQSPAEARPGNHLAYANNKLVLTSERNGKTLTIHLAADDPALRHISACSNSWATAAFAATADHCRVHQRHRSRTQSVP